jgi:hypothetical protein
MAARAIASGGPAVTACLSAAASSDTRGGGEAATRPHSVKSNVAPHRSVQIIGVPTARDSFTSIPQPSKRLGRTVQSADASSDGLPLMRWSCRSRVRQWAAERVPRKESKA